MARTTRTMVVGGMLLLLCAPWAAAEARVRRVTIVSDRIPAEVKESFGPVRQGEEVVLEIAVANHRDEVLSIGAVQPLCACMSERSDRSIQPGSTGTISLHLDTEEYAGPTTEAALIQWANAGVAVTRVELNLDVQPVLEVLPKRLVRFRAVQGTASEQVVELRTTDSAPFKVSRVEASAPHLSAFAEAVSPGLCRLTIKLSADAPAGMLRETVKVHTDLPTLPAVTVNVTGVVAAATADAPQGSTTS